MVVACTDILLDMVFKLDSPDVALVHQMPFTTDQPGFAHAVEKVRFRPVHHCTDQLRLVRLAKCRCPTQRSELQLVRCRGSSKEDEGP